MLMFDSSGANKEGARSEHQDALRISVVKASAMPEADPLAVTCALDWLLYDWLMAHRDGPDSAEIVFPRPMRRRCGSGGFRGRGLGGGSVDVRSGPVVGLPGRCGRLIAARPSTARAAVRRVPGEANRTHVRSGLCPSAPGSRWRYVTSALERGNPPPCGNSGKTTSSNFFRVAGGPVDRRAPDVAVW